MHNNLSFTICIIDADTTALKNISLLQNKYLLSHSDFVSEYTSTYDSVFLITNACISGTNGEPLGLFITDYHKFSDVNIEDGNGNFYIKPNGALLITDTNASVVQTSEINTTGHYRVAVQSGPMLVTNNEINTSFDVNSKNKNIRSGVGLFKQNNKSYLLFCLSNEPITFYQFANLFKSKYQCNNALCLESAGSAFFSPKIGNIPPVTGSVVGNYLIVKKYNLSARQHKQVIKMIKSPNGTYDVPVELNGVLKINFILDSGASDVSISPDVALTLIKTGTISESDFIGTQQYRFANGSTATSQVFYLNEVKVGDLTLKKVRATISNSVDAPMLLGQSVLQRLGKFSIDNTNHTLELN